MSNLIKPEIETGIQEVETYAKGIVVDCGDARTAAINFLQQIKRQKKTVMDFFDEPKQKAHEAWKAIVAREKFFTNRIDNAEIIVKKEILGYDQEIERKQAELEAKLRAEAEEKARKLREKHMKRAENLKTPEKKAEAMEAAERVEVDMPVVESEIEKTGAESKQTVWRARVVNADIIPREYLMPNEKMLNGVARATKGSVKIAGVEFYSEKILKVKS